MASCIKCNQEMGGNLGISICQDCVSQLLEGKTIEELVALAKTGLEALIDEATGYQKIRAKNDLSRRLKQYQGGESD